MEEYAREFEGLVSLYTKTKALILRAEQVDPDSASNIAVFKEQRDAADHVMRILGAMHFNPPDGVTKDDYIRTHFDKARSHLFRASFDSLDGIGLSSKLLLKQDIAGISNEAISAVYPTYWEKVVEFDKLDEEVTKHRNAKDIGSNTLSHLESYSAVVDGLHATAQEIRQHIKHLRDWDARNKEKASKDARLDLRKEVIKFFLFAFIGGLVLEAVKAALLKPAPLSRPPAAMAATNGPVQANPPPSTNPSASVPKAP
ncbi:MAG: hypothetical protein ABSH34_34465 [Verrucomicrobiota bacterium]|jgi:hypothetical protein